MKSALQHTADENLESLTEGADRGEALRLWHEQQRENEPPDAFLLAELVDRLGILFEFFAASTTPTGTAARVWTALYAVRPDLIGHETIQQGADRLGISQQRLCQQLDGFKKKTGFVYPSRVGACDAERARMRIEAMSRARSAKAERFRRAREAA